MDLELMAVLYGSVSHNLLLPVLLVPTHGKVGRKTGQLETSAWRMLLLFFFFAPWTKKATGIFACKLFSARSVRYKRKVAYLRLPIYQTFLPVGSHLPQNVFTTALAYGCQKRTFFCLCKLRDVIDVEAKLFYSQCTTFLQ